MALAMSERKRCPGCGLELLLRYFTPGEKLCTACVAERTAPRKIRHRGVDMTTDDYNPDRSEVD